ncbi:MAG: lipocalin family protein [Phocaeicola sp.]
MKTIMALLFFSCFLCCASDTSSSSNRNSTSNELDISVIQSLDVDRYMGKWFEIARFDHSFERGMDSVTAEYVKNANGTIQVINRGYKADKGFSVAKGKAKTTTEPGVLKVSFFWIFYSQYRILELDDEYQYALIGSSSAKYLWILSRVPVMEKEQLEQLLEKARKRGYDTSKLIYPKQ